MKDDLIKGLAGLGLKNSQIEKELQLPLNSLSAVLNGKKPMPDKWCAKVRIYLLEKNPPAPQEIPKPIKDPTRPWIEEIEQYCRSKGFYPDFLIEFHQTHSNSATVNAMEGLKKALNQNGEDRKVSLKEYAENHNRQLTRRGKKMSESYIYRVIRNDVAKTPNVRSPWFTYTMKGEKDRIWILL